MGRMVCRDYQERRQPTERLVYTSLGQTLRHAKEAQQTVDAAAASSSSLLHLSFALLSSSDGDQGPVFARAVLPMLIRSTPSSTDSKTSVPIACRAFWLIQLV